MKMAAAGRKIQTGITDVQIVRAHGVLSDHYNQVTQLVGASEAGADLPVIFRTS